MIFSKNNLFFFWKSRIIPLPLPIYDLDLISTFSYHSCQPSHQFWYRLDQWYMIYWQKSVCITDGLPGLTGWRTDKQTDGPPNQLINQWTNETFYRGASQSLGASKQLILLFLGYNRLMVSVYYHRNDTFTFDFNWYGPSSVFWRRRMSIRLRKSRYGPSSLMTSIQKPL